MTTIVHDTIFDYFGITTQQIEISGAKNDKDMEFKLKMLRQAQDLLQEFEKEDSAPIEPSSEQLQILSDTL